MPFLFPQPVAAIWSMAFGAGCGHISSHWPDGLDFFHLDQKQTPLLPANRLRCHIFSKQVFPALLYTYMN
jgi:hypothetical protein